MCRSGWSGKTLGRNGNRLVAALIEDFEAELGRRALARSDAFPETQPGFAVEQLRRQGAANGGRAVVEAHVSDDVAGADGYRLPPSVPRRLYVTRADVLSDSVGQADGFRHVWILVDRLRLTWGWESDGRAFSLTAGADGNNGLRV